MRRLLPLLLALTLALLAADWPDLSRVPPAEGGGERDAALVVGISDYWKLADVPGAAESARDWVRWLRDTRGVPAVKLLENGEATREAVLEAAADVAARTGDGGTAWFVFVGHGAPPRDGGGEPVLVGADAQPTVTGLYPRSLGRQELLAVLERGPQAETVVVLDACFSGKGATGDALVEGLQPALLSGTWRPSRSTVLTAARADQFAGPLPGLGRPAFSYLLLGALRGWGDGDRDGRVTAGEAVQWTDRALFELVTGRRQQPELVGPGAALVLAAPTRPEAPPDLLEILGDGAAPVVAPVLEATVSTGDGNGGDYLAQLAQLQEARRQREEAERKEREAQAYLEARRKEKMAEASATLQREAASAWRATRPLLEGGGPEARQAVEAWLTRYGDAEVRVTDATGTYREAVPVPEVASARAWLQEHPDTGDAGDAGAGSGGGAVSPGRAGIEWVSIPGRTFSMSRSEVTVAQYRACVEAGACEAPTNCHSASTWGKSGMDDHPVNCVDWNHAQAFARWAGGRLPTDEEWEYAARGGQSYEYAGSDDVDAVAWYKDNSGGGTHAVCGKRRNGYGLCDMSGNVWEWTAAPNGSNRVLRGGSWLEGPYIARVAYRYRNLPGGRWAFLGLRLVRPDPYP